VHKALSAERNAPTGERSAVHCRDSLGRAASQESAVGHPADLARLAGRGGVCNAAYDDFLSPEPGGMR